MRENHLNILFYLKHAGTFFVTRYFKLCSHWKMIVKIPYVFCLRNTLSQIYTTVSLSRKILC